MAYLKVLRSFKMLCQFFRTRDLIHDIAPRTWSDLYISTQQDAVLLANSNNDPDAVKRSLSLCKSLIMQVLKLAYFPRS